MQALKSFNKQFLLTLVVLIVIQVIIVQFGGTMFGLKENGYGIIMWGLSIIIGAIPASIEFIFDILPLKIEDQW